MQHANDNAERRRRERAIAIFGAIWAVILAVLVGSPLLPSGPGAVLGLLGR